jgi:hypothetical protein
LPILASGQSVIHPTLPLPSLMRDNQAMPAVRHMIYDRAELTLSLLGIPPSH